MRRSRSDIERDWYGCFAKWSHADRAAALKVLAILHDTLPDRQPVAPKNPPQVENQPQIEQQREEKR